MKRKNLLRETARDLIALGSPLFFVIVIARISILSNYEYLSQFIIAGVLFFTLMFFFKGNLYSGLGLIVLVFTTLFYNNLKFSIFAILIYLGLIVSLIYLKTDKEKVFKGVLAGAISTAISYFIVDFIF